MLRFVEIIKFSGLFYLSHTTYGFLPYPVLINHIKWGIGEYLVTYTLVVTLLVEFLVEIASGLGHLDRDCSSL